MVDIVTSCQDLDQKSTVKAVSHPIQASPSYSASPLVRDKKPAHKKPVKDLSIWAMFKGIVPGEALGAAGPASYLCSKLKLSSEGVDKWLRRRAPVLKVHGSNPTMTCLKITSLLSLPYRHQHNICNCNA